MTDAEITEFIAVQVMGWQRPLVPAVFWDVPDGAVPLFVPFRPLNDANHCQMARNKMREFGWEWSLASSCRKGKIFARIFREELNLVEHDRSENHACCLAIVKAIQAQEGH